MKLLPVFFRDRIRTVVVSGLDNGKERLGLLPESFVRLQEQVLIADAPYIYLRSAVVLLFVELQSFDIIGQQSPDIRPACATSQEIEFIIALEIIDDRV